MGFILPIKPELYRKLDVVRWCSIGVLFIIFAAFTNSLHKFESFLLATGYSCVEYTWYTVSAENEHGEAFFVGFGDKRARKGFTAFEQWWMNVLALPFLLHYYNVLVTSAVLRALLFPFWVWFLEYKDGEEVNLWFNKVGPYHNPQETYSYYSLPFCKPASEESAKKLMREKDDGLGSVLEGNELTDSGLLVKFKEDQVKHKLCDLKLDEDAAKKFTGAVSQHYWYQMYIDDLPIWGMVGELMAADSGSESGARLEQGFLYTHKDFSIAYNGNQIIEVNLTSEEPRPIIAGETHPMTFSVKWVQTDGSFEHRFDRYLDFDFFEHQIHTFSIFNSFMMVIFLCGLVALILMRTLKNDYARYSLEESDDIEIDRVVDESGWKQVHGDVFRAPPYLRLYSALIGTGWQLLTVTFCMILLTIVSTYIDDHHLFKRGGLTSTVVLLYCLSSVVAGYKGSAHYKTYGGEDWQQTMVLTALLFPGCSFGLAFLLNFIAIGYSAMIAIPFTTMLSMLAIWLLVSSPLVLLGTVFGRAAANKGDFPCRVNNLKRPIPDGPWYTRPAIMALFGGVLPFGSIFIEMYFIFTSFWNYKFYYVYGFMLLVYIILITVTVCVCVVSTYFLLNAEDYRWQWTAFFSGGSTALYVYLYAIYYFFSKTRMSGTLQTAFYFGYMAIFCFSLFILTGTIGVIGTEIFVRRIYQYIKSD